MGKEHYNESTNRKEIGYLFFDPFAGSGTSLLTAQQCGMSSIGVDNHPFVSRIGKTKSNWNIDITSYLRLSYSVLNKAKLDNRNYLCDSPLLNKCYTKESLNNLNRLRMAFLEEQQNDDISNLVWLTITSILRSCSFVNTAQCQYIQPNKFKKRVDNVFEAFEKRILLFKEDIAYQYSLNNKIQPIDMLLDDSRKTDNFKNIKNKVDLVVTSPPYPNNYDYADSTRLEMTFWQDISGYGDLQNKVRKRLIRSCSQHSSSEKLLLEELLDDDSIKPIRDELASVCFDLSEIRKTRKERKTYHTMVGAYFVDMSSVLTTLRYVCNNKSQVNLVIGDSVPYEGMFL